MPLSAKYPVGSAGAVPVPSVNVTLLQSLSIVTVPNFSTSILSTSVPNVVTKAVGLPAVCMKAGWSGVDTNAVGLPVVSTKAGRNGVPKKAVGKPDVSTNTGWSGVDTNAVGRPGVSKNR